MEKYGLMHKTWVTCTPNPTHSIYRFWDNVSYYPVIFFREYLAYFSNNKRKLHFGFSVCVFVPSLIKYGVIIYYRFID